MTEFPGPSAPKTAVIAGIGSYLPPSLVTNAELAARLDTSDQWIRSRTGIATRHVVSAGMATSDLAVEAGQRALESAGKCQADMVVLATTTPDRPCPATAPEVAARLGLNGVAAFDVAAVCSGFLYALATATGLIAAAMANRVLLIAADAFTTIVDPSDRSTAVIFADGAGALVLRTGAADEPGSVGPMVLGSDGDLSDLIEVPAGGSRQRSSRRLPTPGDEYFTMRGRDIYRHAVQRMTSASQRAMAAAGWATEDVDRFAAHQANARILESVAGRLGLPAEKRLSNIERVGNTGAASVPVLLAESAADNSLTAGQRVLLTTFGGGLTWGAATLVWPDLKAITA
ncbi:beta-ketoacyl-ACP synthase III [Streptomyces sp. NPDC051909]|uniref:beta-ketoacyl-ACP synthase III n=1 Tax=Streptomyces sp. NPDC051909 TaxID=3154944 RepID=UPI003449B23C